jgi:RNA polymerase sigma-70 factor (ECF subfamily)
MMLRAPCSAAVPPVASSGAATRSLGDRLDPESRRWLDGLGGVGRVREDAVARLHELLLRAARFEVARRRRALAHLRGGDDDDLAQQAADDALVAVLAKLPEFRGDSRFTTWAYKFALYEAAVKLRRRAWQDRELPLEPDSWPQIACADALPEEQAAQSELLVAVQAAIAEELSEHQREVLVAVTLNGVPIDVLAERLNTTRGALYKTLHDARKKLRRRLTTAGFDVADSKGSLT